MRRRAMLGAIGSGIAVLAGCSGRSEPQPAGTAPPETTAPGTEPPAGTEPSPTPPETERVAEETPAAAGPDALRLQSVEAPEEVEIGASARYRFTVENAGESPLTVEPAVEARWEGSTWTLHDTWGPVEVLPGERRTFRSSPLTSEYLQTVELRTVGFDPVSTVEFVEMHLPLSAGYRDPLGREVTVHGVSFKSSYTYTKDGTYRVVELDGDLQFVFVDFEVVNRTDGPLPAPAPGTVTLEVGDRSLHSVPMLGDAGYEAGELQWGARTSGRVAFETVGGLSSDEIRIEWAESFDDGDVAVVWTPE